MQGVLEWCTFFEIFKNLSYDFETKQGHLHWGFASRGNIFQEQNLMQLSLPPDTHMHSIKGNPVQKYSACSPF